MALRLGQPLRRRVQDHRRRRWRMAAQEEERQSSGSQDHNRKNSRFSFQSCSPEFIPGQRLRNIS